MFVCVGPRDASLRNPSNCIKLMVTKLIKHEARVLLSHEAYSDT